MSSYNTAASRLLRPSRLSYQSPSHSWMLMCRRLHLVTPFRMCRRRRVDQPVSSLSLDVAVQMSSHGIHISSIDAAVQTIPHSTLSQHVSTQKGFRSVSSFSVEISVQTPIRSVVLHDVAIQLPIMEFFTGCILSNDPLDRQNLVRQPPSSVQGPRALLQPPPGLEQLAPPSGPATGSHLHTTHGASTAAAPLRARLRSAFQLRLHSPSDHVPHISDQFMAYTGNTDASLSCSTRILLSLNPKFSPSILTLRAKVLGV